MICIIITNYRYIELTPPLYLMFKNIFNMYDTGLLWWLNNQASTSRYDEKL